MTELKKALLAIAGIWAVGVGNVAAAAFSDNEMRIAVMTDMTAEFADAAGLGSQLAAEMAVDDFGGDLPPVRVTVYDDAGLSAGAAADAAAKLVAGGVDLIVGMVGDHSAQGVQAAAGHGRAVVMSTGAVSDRLTGTDCGDTAFHWGPGLYVITQVTRSDLTPANSTRTIFIYGSGRHEAIRNTYETGLLEQGQDVTGQVFVSDIRSIGLYVANGMRLLTPYYWDANEPSRAFADRFEARNGSRPTYIHAATYSAVHHYLRAVQAVGSDDPVGVSRRMHSMSPEGFYAQNGVVRPDGQLVQDIYLARVKQPTESTVAWDYLRILHKLDGDAIYQPAVESRCRAQGSI